MFERFTDRARTAVIAARAEATARGDQIRPVYMLHALASGEGVAARVLAGLGVDAGDIERRLDRTAPLRKPHEGEPPGDDAEALASIGIDLDEIRRKVEENFGPGALERSPAAPHGAGRTTMTREAKQSVELAAREARARSWPPFKPPNCPSASSIPPGSATSPWPKAAGPKMIRSTPQSSPPTARPSPPPPRRCPMQCWRNCAPWSNGAINSRNSSFAPVNMPNMPP